MSALQAQQRVHACWRLRSAGGGPPAALRAPPSGPQVAAAASSGPSRSTHCRPSLLPAAQAEECPEPGHSLPLLAPWLLLATGRPALVQGVTGNTCSRGRSTQRRGITSPRMAPQHGRCAPSRSGPCCLSTARCHGTGSRPPPQPGNHARQQHMQAPRPPCTLHAPMAAAGSLSPREPTQKRPMRAAEASYDCMAGHPSPACRARKSSCGETPGRSRHSSILHNRPRFRPPAGPCTRPIAPCRTSKCRACADCWAGLGL